MSPEAATRLEANLAVLRRRQPELADFLARLVALSPPPGQPTLELLPNPTGEPGARLGGLLFHSLRDPRGEARRLLSAALPPGAEAVLVLGAGLGYGLEAALAEPGVTQVLLCEAEPLLLLAALQTRDLRTILGDERLGFLLGGRPEALLPALEALGLHAFGLLGSRAAESAFPDWYARLRAAAERFRAKTAINENTLRRFGRLWVRNLARNLPALRELPGIGGLEGAAAGFPALVLAAGPSLDELRPFLPALRERALLIAVDTALRSLLAWGIEPDFLVVVDPQYWNWRHLAGLAAPRALLISEPAVYPAVLRFPCRARFLAESIYPLGRALGGAGRGLLGAGGSVATSAWDLARHLGASRVFLGGLDLGYPGGATHARASLFEQRALAQAGRLAPAAGFQAGALFGAPARFVPDNAGGLLRSDERMQLYAWWFESRLARPDAPPTASLSRKGAAIPGMVPAAVEELLNQAPRRAEIEALLDRLARLPPPENQAALLAAARERLRAGLRDLAREASAARDAASAARRSLAQGADPRASLAALATADRALLANDSRDVAGFLLSPLGELLRNRPRDLAESLTQSERLYGEIAESAAYHEALLSSSP